MSDPSPSASASGRTTRLERMLGRLFGRTDEKKDLIEHLREAQEHDVIDADAMAMIEGVLQVADLQVRDLMIPRSQMDVVDISAPIDDILEHVVATSHSRFPVIDSNRDNIIGILLAKDLLRCLVRRERDLRAMLRPAVFVPDSRRLNVMLDDFRSNRNHMAIVIDEYGEVAGIITIEDVLEQIVGDIEDEHDIGRDEGNILELSSPSGRWRIRALTPISQFNEVLGASLINEQMETVGGIVTDAFGRVPRRGETIDIEGFRFEIRRADARQIHLLTVSRLTSTAD
jgi:magnesium and cobalt transporter